MSTWEVEHDRTNVVCPDCAFSFDAIHQDGDGGYTCPLCEPAPASGESSGAEAVVREAKATPLSDAAVARIIEAVEAHCGMGRGAWDMVSARDLVEGFAAVFGADTRRVDALVEALRDCEEVLRLIHEAAGPVPKDAPMPRTTSWGAWKAAREALGLPTAPGAPEEGAGE